MCWISFDSRYCKCPFHQSCITSWASWLVLLLLCPKNHAWKSLCNLQTLKPCCVNFVHVSYNSWRVFSFQTSFIPPNLIYILFKPLLLWKITSELTRKPHSSSSYYNCDTRLPFTILTTIIPHELLERKILMALLIVWLLLGFSKKNQDQDVWQYYPHLLSQAQCILPAINTTPWTLHSFLTICLSCWNPSCTSFIIHMSNKPCR